MTFLKEYALRYPTTEETLDAFAGDMSARYHIDPSRPVIGERWVRCSWFIEYQSSAQKAATLLSIPLLIFAHHGAFQMKRYKFETCHLLTVGEAKRLIWLNRARRLFLPFATFGTMVVGLAYLFGMIGMISLLVLHGLPKESWGVRNMVIICIGGGLALAAMLRVHMALRKMGRPPGAKEFDDQRIKLESVHFERSA